MNILNDEMYDIRNGIQNFNTYYSAISGLLRQTSERYKTTLFPNNRRLQLWNKTEHLAELSQIWYFIVSDAGARAKSNKRSKVHEIKQSSTLTVRK